MSRDRLRRRAEQASEQADANSGAVESETACSGPAETLGERADQVEESAKGTAEARADALEDQADPAR